MLKKLTALILIMVWVWQFCGCSAIGLGIGALSDSKKPNQVPGWEVEKVQPGKTVTLVLRDSSQIKGKFIGLEKLQDQEYAETYNQIRELKPDGVVLPKLDDTVSITTEAGKKFEGEFFGFDEGYIPVRIIGRNITNQISINNIKRIEQREGNAISKTMIEKLLTDGRIPSRSMIVMKNELGKTRTKIEKISQIQNPVKKNGKWIGLGIGAAIDAAVLIVLHNYSHESTWGFPWPFSH
jgi:hypothetical protein